MYSWHSLCYKHRGISAQGTRRTWTEQAARKSALLSDLFWGCHFEVVGRFVCFCHLESLAGGRGLCIRLTTWYDRSFKQLWKPAKNPGLNGIRTHDHCDTTAVLYQQLVYWENWLELTVYQPWWFLNSFTSLPDSFQTRYCWQFKEQSNAIDFVNGSEFPVIDFSVSIFVK